MSLFCFHSWMFLLNIEFWVDSVFVVVFSTLNLSLHSLWAFMVSDEKLANVLSMQYFVFLLLIFMILHLWLKQFCCDLPLFELLYISSLWCSLSILYLKMLVFYQVREIKKIISSDIFCVSSLFSPYSIIINMFLTIWYILIGLWDSIQILAFFCVFHLR